MNSRFLKICTLFLLCLNCSNSIAQNAKHPIIDAHCHIRTTPDETMLQTMDEYFATNKSVDISYLFGITMAKKGEIEKTRERNDSLFAMAKRNSRFIPVCSVHPNDGDAAIEELRRIKKLGGKIIKLHPLTQQFTILSNETVKVVKEAGALDLVVLMDGYGFIVPNYLEHLIQLSMVSQQTKFIIAHMGGPDFYKIAGFTLVKTLNPKMLSNVWYDLSATIHIYADSPYRSQFEWAIRNIGTDRILFGSDQPAVTLQNALDDFNKLDLSDDEKEQISYKNAKNLLGL